MKSKPSQVEEVRRRGYLERSVTGERCGTCFSMTGHSVDKMLEGERDKLLRRKIALHESVHGDKMKRLSGVNAVRRSRSGLADPNRPNGSSLLGADRVGLRRELCKVFSEILFVLSRHWFE